MKIRPRKERRKRLLSLFIGLGIVGAVFGLITKSWLLVVASVILMWVAYSEKRRE